jgi:Cu/Ag efflux pump CusA
MIDRFVTLCLKRRQVVWLIAILMIVFGYFSWKALKI